jgi:uncharacterized phage-like protein YoqJ
MKKIVEYFPQFSSLIVGAMGFELSAANVRQLPAIVFIPVREAMKKIVEYFPQFSSLIVGAMGFELSAANVRQLLCIHFLYH